MNNRSGLGVIIGILAVLIFALPMGFLLLLSGSSPDCESSLAAGIVGTIPEGAAGFDREQLTNAAEIIRAGAAEGVSSRDQTIAIMTAIGESTLRVLDSGDAAGPDSRGLFQQRDNGAWGSYQDRMDPFTSSRNFFRALKTVSGRDTMEPTLVAHRVQRNANPQHYARFWNQAQQVFTALTGATPGLGDAPQTGGSSRYKLGPVKPHVAAAADHIGRLFDVATIGGWRPGDTYDTEGHPAGLALDVMITSRDQGARIAAYAREHAAELSVKYVIWYQRIWSAQRDSEGWRIMGDRGSDSANHRDHVHISFEAAPGTTPLPQAGAPLVDGCGIAAVVIDGQAAAATPGQWVQPAPGPITSRYGNRKHPTTGVYKLHSGTDLAGGGCDAPIKAAKAGTVIGAGPSAGYGNLITIDHGGGVLTRYAHMYGSGILVKTGQHVDSGQTIGRIGSAGYSTGCHLHFEIKINGSFTDPQTYLANYSLHLG